MARIIKEGKHVYWLDGEGLKVPVEYVSEEDQQRDKFVDDLIDDAERLQGLIGSYKAKMQKKVEAYLDEVASNYGEAWQGNARIRNFSQTAEVEIRQAKLLSLDIQEEQWLEAMEIIKKSIRVESTKQYLNFRCKDESGQFKTITLNYSAL